MHPVQQIPRIRHPTPNERRKYLRTRDVAWDENDVERRDKVSTPRETMQDYFGEDLGDIQKISPTSPILENTKSVPFNRHWYRLSIF